MAFTDAAKALKLAGFVAHGLDLIILAINFVEAQIQAHISRSHTYKHSLHTKAYCKSFESVGSKTAKKSLTKTLIETQFAGMEQSMKFGNV